MSYVDFKVLKRVPGADVAAAGAVGTFDLTDIKDPILRIVITQWGTGDGGDIPTLAETLAALGTIQVKRAGSPIVIWDAEDLYDYLMAKFITKPKFAGAAGTSNLIRLTIWLDFALNKLREYDFLHGLTHTAEQSLTLEIVSGGDTAGGRLASSGAIDAVAVVGKGMGPPAFYLGHRLRSYTAAANEDEEVSLPLGAGGIEDFLAFITTDVDDGVTAETTTIENVRILINEEEDVVRRVPWELWLADEDLTEDYYRYFPIHYLKTLDVKTKVVFLGGDANAARAYVGALYRN